MTTAEDYAEQLRGLLAQGEFWRRLVRSPIFSAFLLAICDTFARVHAFIDQLRLEADPRTTTQLVDEWEASVGLPDGCIAGGGSIEQRRAAIEAQLNATGGCTPAYYVGLAAIYGYAVTITDLGPSHWRVNSASATVEVNMTCDGTCDDALESYGNNQLECLINRVKQAHCVVEFAYGAP